MCLSIAVGIFLCSPAAVVAMLWMAKYSYRILYRCSVRNVIFLSLHSLFWTRGNPSFLPEKTSISWIMVTEITTKCPLFCQSAFHHGRKTTVSYYSEKLYWRYVVPDMPLRLTCQMSSVSKVVDNVVSWWGDNCRIML